MNDRNSIIIIFWKSNPWFKNGETYYWDFLPYQDHFTIDDVLKIEVETTFTNFQAYWMKDQQFMQKGQRIYNLNKSFTKDYVMEKENQGIGMTWLYIFVKFSVYIYFLFL